MSEKELVTITIDGNQVRVPKGTNLIEAARLAGIDVPYYCYHPHLSIAGNCRMCQVQVEGQPKLTIACNTGATEGMVVRTQESSADVEEAQRATLEFLLINHPLDCTVCDQAGHCKLQDYYYEYNAKASRFTEDKVHKIKADPVGPEVIFDGERCIVCTRCVRFCNEVTGTGELGAYNRGDEAVIGIAPGKELNNPLSGTVVDLCPVGALTHRRWRFNTRIWYTHQVNSLCVGCSTGCNTQVAARDGQIVHVKARLNSDVNKEWLCDEGRYGFHRFQPQERLGQPLFSKSEGEWKAVLAEAAKLKSSLNDGAVFLSPFLTLEEMWISLQFAEKVMGVTPESGRLAGQVRLRQLTDIERILVSPDYAPNARALALLGMVEDGPSWREELARLYDQLLTDVRARKFKRLLFVGDLSILPSDIDSSFVAAVESCDMAVALTPRALAPAEQNGSAVKHISNFTRASLPSLTVYEKTGVMVNRDGRFQRLLPLFPPVFGAMPEWLLLHRIAEAAGVKLLPAEVSDERSLFRHVAGSFGPLKGATLMKIGELGMLEDGDRIVSAPGTDSSFAAVR